MRARLGVQTVSVPVEASVLAEGDAMTFTRKPIDWSCLAEDYAALGSQRAVADKYGCSPSLVYQYMKAAGLKASYRADRRSRTHGCSGTRLYATWSDMKQRCLNPRAREFPRYGGRGITVCPEWMDLEPFSAWALANAYRDDLSIERIDNNAGYDPSNCTWIPPARQAKNLRNNRHITFEGATRNLREWGRATGIDARTIAGRVDRGWSIERALTAPVGTRERTA